MYYSILCRIWQDVELSLIHIFKIAGVQHEFTTIPGVKEDVTEIVLNVKGIIAKLYCEGVKTVHIEAAGECKVTAGDIKADADVEILNPDLHIATLGPDATLSMELTLSHGRGYIPADKNKSAQSVIGVIPVDSIYTPCLLYTSPYGDECHGSSRSRSAA